MVTHRFPVLAAPSFAQKISELNTKRGGNDRGQLAAESYEK